jgi:ABC-type glycerol-3-phosphate transport system substrate-binding protein
MPTQKMSARKKTMIAAFAAVAIVTAACAAPPAPAAPAATSAPAAAEATEAPAASGGEVSADSTGEITVYTVAGAPAKVLDLMKAQFNAKYPNVTVTINTHGSGDFAEAMYAKGAANNLEDIIFNADLFVPPFVDADLLVDMEPLAKADGDFNLDDIYPSILGLGQVGFKPGIYMIPSGLDTVQLYYNKTMWEAAGAPLPTDKTTWDEFIAACKVVMEKNPDTYCFDHGPGNWWAYFVPWVEGYGGRVLSEDGKTSQFSTPEARAGLAAYGELWTTHKVAVPPGTTIADCFVVEKCAAFFHIPAFINDFRTKVGDKFEWDVAFAPALPKKHVTGMGTYGFSISKNAKNPQLAWEFLKLMAMKDTQLELFKQRLTAPLLKSMATDPAVASPDDGQPPKNMAAFVNGGNIGIFPQNYPVKCGGLYSGQVNSAINAMLESIIRGAKSVDQATTDADAEIQACLDRGG